MSGLDDPQAFARAWNDAWNARDLDTVLGFFAEDAVFTSPLAAKVVPDSGGVIRGHEAMRAYWTEALARNPVLHFELTTIYGGVDILLVGFKTSDGADRFEVLRFKGDKVAEGWGTYRVG